MKKNSVCSLARAIGFLIVFFIMLSFVTRILIPKWTGNTPSTLSMDGFYAEPKNSLDVLYLGSSSVLRAVSPMTIWSEYGICGYSRANPLQGPIISYSLLLDSLESQHPKVVVVDFAWAFDEFDADKEETYTHMILDSMPISKIKIDAISGIVAQGKRQNATDYLFPPALLPYAVE